ncbi:hypothetical protein [Mycobacterium talmoniae]|uniref:Uncharacterized protein n=1 Tax=Mycobacterium talmoniae TaxID=1858794 RepID=A0A1S1NIJ5_9MYCO|nr:MULTISPECIES: hypothetical protein [Mycobacterium]OHV05806.1 hypothetical protein BKN37_04365 [Mycobacterium talmoniae]TDH57667.1 hypothetical protein E2F47_00300 [Mycobacterium eburneum]
MWCPSATLSVWANAWLAGQAAPDDVLDALTLWAPRQSVTAYDAVAAGNTGLPWPDVHEAGVMSLLQTVRAAAGRPTAPAIAMVLPVPGDVRGLPAGTQFERDALTAGEALLVADPDGSDTAIGLVPDFEHDDADDNTSAIQTLSWTVYALPGAPVLDHHDLGEAEHALRSAVRSAADALAAIELGGTDAAGDDPRALVAQVLETARHHQVPDHAPPRAVRVLDNAAHVDAILTVEGLMPIGAQSSSDAQLAGTALRPLAAVVRSARIAAVNAIVQSAWRV